MSTSFYKFSLFFILLTLGKVLSQEELPDISSGYEYPKKDDTDFYWVPIFGTNDIHGKIFPAQYPHPDKVNTYKSGGVEYIYAYKKIIEQEWKEEGQEKSRMLWLDGGDQFQGGLEFQLSNGTIMNDFYNLAGLDAMTIGNHEFDFGLSELQKAMKGSHFPYLVANVKDINENKYIYDLWENTKPYKLFTVGKVKIGVIGLATMQTPTTTGCNPTNLIFEPYHDIVVKYAKELREQGANAVILLPHFGPSCPDPENKKLDIDLRDKNTQQCSCDQGQEYNELLATLEENVIDAAVAAHVHDVTHHWISNVPVIETNGPFFSHVLYLPFKEVEGKYVLQRDKIKIEGPLPACEKIFSNTKRCDYVPLGETSQGELTNYKFHGQEILIDKKMEETLSKWKEQIEAKLKHIIVDNEEKMFIDSFHETALSNLVTDVGRKITGADIALFNLGGFRAQWYPGKLNEVDLFNMFPFDNKYIRMEMTGREVVRMVKQIQSGYSVVPSSGLIQLFKKSGERIKILDAKLFDGYLEKSIQLDKSYTICVNDFLASGGGFFGKVLKWYKKRNEQDFGIIRTHMTNYLLALKKIAKGDLIDPNHPRVRYIN